MGKTYLTIGDKNYRINLDNSTIKAKDLAAALGPTESLRYIKSADGTYAICTGFEDDSYKTKETFIIIANNYEGVPVKSIDTEAFKNCKLTGIKIPTSIEIIGDGAFAGCKSLTSVLVRDNLINITAVIGNKIFVLHNNFEAITTPNSLISIGKSAFDGCSNLTSIEIPDSVTSIGARAFYYCCNLSDIKIPKAVMSIGSYAFYSCESLTSVELPDSVTSIGNEAFSDCYSLTEIKYNAIECADLTSNNDVFRYAGTNGTGINVTIGANVKKIPAYLFYPQVRTGMNLFYYAPKIVSVEFEAESICENIGEHAFHDCTSLTDIVIPNSVTSIGNEAFRNCSGLLSMVIPDNVTNIGEYVFFYCKGLTSVVIPDGVTTIGEHAFSDCSSLTSVVIPDSITSIGSFAFSGCSRLVEVINKSTHITVTKGSTSNGYVGYYAWAVYNSGDVFEGTKLSNDNGYIIYTDSEEKILITYTGTETNLVLPSYITQLNQHVFAECNSLTSVVIPDNVTSISDNAFALCKNLTDIEIGRGVISIGYRAFYYCESLASIVIPDSVTTIDYWAFYSCGRLASVEIGSSVTAIDETAFVNCGSLTSIIVDKDNRIYSSLDGSLYNKNQTQLIQYAAGKTTTEFIIPDSVTSIGSYAFDSCDSLTSVVIGDSVTSIGEYAFNSCHNLKSIIIPDSVTYVGNLAFGNGCSIKVYCEATSKPTGWDYHWILENSNNKAIWGYKPGTAISVFE